MLKYPKYLGFPEGSLELLEEPVREHLAAAGFVCEAPCHQHKHELFSPRIGVDQTKGSLPVPNFERSNALICFAPITYRR